MKRGLGIAQLLLQQPKPVFFFLGSSFILLGNWFNLSPQLIYLCFQSLCVFKNPKFWKAQVQTLSAMAKASSVVALTAVLYAILSAAQEAPAPSPVSLSFDSAFVAVVAALWCVERLGILPFVFSKAEYRFSSSWLWILLLLLGWILWISEHIISWVNNSFILKKKFWVIDSSPSIPINRFDAREIWVIVRRDYRRRRATIPSCLSQLENETPKPNLTRLALESLNFLWASSLALELLNFSCRTSGEVSAMAKLKN